MTFILRQMRCWPFWTVLHGSSSEEIETSNSNRICFVPWWSETSWQKYENRKVTSHYTKSPWKYHSVRSRLAQELPFGLHSLSTVCADLQKNDALWLPLVDRPSRRSGTCTWRPPTNKELHRQWKPCRNFESSRLRQEHLLKCAFLMAAGSKSSLSIYGVIAFPIAPQVEETHHAQVPNTLIPMIRQTLQPNAPESPCQECCLCQSWTNDPRALWDPARSPDSFCSLSHIPLESQLLWPVGVQNSVLLAGFPIVINLLPWSVWIILLHLGLKRWKLPLIHI